MQIEQDPIVLQTIEFVKDKLKEAESGHDYFHIERVMKTAVKIAEREIKNGEQYDLQIVKLGALLHDIADHKFHGGDDTIGPKVAEQHLKSLNYDADKIEKVKQIIQFITFKGSQVQDQMPVKEGLAVQDADRMDALGAIGIARTFAYGGFKNRQMYDPNQKPQQHDSFNSYKNSNSTSINHFYEKLLLLKDRMQTKSGKELAEKRHKIMVDYLEQFYSEWECQD